MNAADGTSSKHGGRALPAEDRPACPLRPQIATKGLRKLLPTRLLLVGAIALFPSLLLAVGGCSRYSSTVRVIDGRQVEGRPVLPAAYGHYLQAAVFESGGDLPQALHHYRRARDLDSASPELSTAIGRVSCLLRRADADGEFLRALRLDPRYGPAWRERARCALRNQQPDFAVKYARQAQAWAPDELDTTLTLVVALQHAQQPDEAFTQLHAHAVRHPSDPSAWRAMAKLAARQGRDAWQAYAESRLRAWDVTAPRRSPQAAADAESAPVSAALAAGNDEQASFLAAELRLSPTSLGFLALDFGRVELAARQANLVLAAAPHDADAYILALAAAHRAADEVRLQALLREPPEPNTPSETAVAWLMRVLSERSVPLP